MMLTNRLKYFCCFVSLSRSQQTFHQSELYTVNFKLKLRHIKKRKAQCDLGIKPGTFLL